MIIKSHMMTFRKGLRTARHSTAALRLLAPILLFLQCAFMNEEQAYRSIRANLLMNKLILLSNQSYTNQMQDYIPEMLDFETATHSK